MTHEITIVLLLAATVGSGLIGGLFFIFSNTVMKSLDALPPAAAVAAMNSINRVILNPLFFLAFFGTAALCLTLLVIYGPNIDQRDGVLACGGALIYLVGSIGVTMVFNVPLNNKLAAVSSSATDLASQWRTYRVPWTNWNHVRAIASLLAAAAFALVPWQPG
jgi:uncharacterized membrane protein